MAESHLKYGTNVANTPGSIGIDTTDHTLKYMTDLGVRKTVATTADLGGGSSSNFLTYGVTDASTGANTTETDLWTYTLPGGTLATDGRAIKVTANIAFAANGNTKTVKFYFGATSVTLNNTSTAPNGGTLTFHAVVFRTGASAQVLQRITCSWNATLQNAGGGATPAENTAQDIVVKVTGTNGTASAGDITFKLAYVELV